MIADYRLAFLNSKLFQDASFDWSGIYDIISVMHFTNQELIVAATSTLTPSDSAA